MDMEQAAKDAADADAKAAKIQRGRRMLDRLKAKKQRGKHSCLVDNDARENEIEPSLTQPQVPQPRPQPQEKCFRQETYEPLPSLLRQLRDFQTSSNLLKSYPAEQARSGQTSPTTPPSYHPPPSLCPNNGAYKEGRGHVRASGELGEVHWEVQKEAGQRRSPPVDKQQIVPVQVCEESRFSGISQQIVVSQAASAAVRRGVSKVRAGSQKVHNIVSGIEQQAEAVLLYSREIQRLVKDVELGGCCRLTAKGESRGTEEGESDHGGHVLQAGSGQPPVAFKESEQEVLDAARRKVLQLAADISKAVETWGGSSQKSNATPHLVDCSSLIPSFAFHGRTDISSQEQSHFLSSSFEKPKYQELIIRGLDGLDSLEEQFSDLELKMAQCVALCVPKEQKREQATGKEPDMERVKQLEEEVSRRDDHVRALCQELDILQQGHASLLAESTREASKKAVLVQENEIARMRTELTEEDGNHVVTTKLQERSDVLMEELREHNEQIEILNGELSAREETIHGLQCRLSILEQEAQGEGDLRLRQMGALADDITQLKMERDSLKGIIVSLEVRVVGLTDAASFAEAAAQETSEQLRLFEDSMLEFEYRLKKSQFELECHKERANHEERALLCVKAMLEEKGKAHETLIQEFQAKCEDQMQLEETVSQINKVMKEKAHEIVELKHNLEGKEANLSDLRASLEEQEQLMEELKDKVKHSESDLAERDLQLQYLRERERAIRLQEERESKIRTGIEEAAKRVEDSLIRKVDKMKQLLQTATAVHENRLTTSVVLLEEIEQVCGSLLQERDALLMDREQEKSATAEAERQRLSLQEEVTSIQEVLDVKMRHMAKMSEQLLSYRSENATLEERIQVDSKLRSKDMAALKQQLLVYETEISQVENKLKEAVAAQKHASQELIQTRQELRAALAAAEDSKQNIEVHKCTVVRSQTELDNMKSDMTAKDRLLANLTIEHSSLREKLSKTHMQVESLIASLSGHDEIAYLRDLLQTLHEQVDADGVEKQNLVALLDEHKAALKERDEALDEQRQEIETTASKLLSLRAEVSELVVALSVSQEKLDEQQALTASVSGKLQQKEHEISELMSKMHEEETNWSNVSSELGETQRTLNATRAERDSIQQELTKALQQMDRATKERDLERNDKCSRKEYTRLTSELKSACDRLSDHQTQVKQQKAIIKSKNDEIIRLSKAVRAAQSPKIHKEERPVADVADGSLLGLSVKDCEEERRRILPIHEKREVKSGRDTVHVPDTDSKAELNLMLQSISELEERVRQEEERRSRAEESCELLQEEAEMRNKTLQVCRRENASCQDELRECSQKLQASQEELECERTIKAQLQSSIDSLRAKITSLEIQCREEERNSLETREWQLYASDLNDQLASAQNLCSTLEMHLADERTVSRCEKEKRLTQEVRMEHLMRGLQQEASELRDDLHLFQVRSRSATEEIQALKEAYADLKDQEAATRAQLESRDAHEGLEALRRTNHLELSHDLLREQREWEAGLEQLQFPLQLLETTIFSLQTSVLSLQAEREGGKHDASRTTSLYAQITVLKKDKRMLHAKVDGLQVQYAELKAQMHSSTLELQGKTDDIAAAHTDLEVCAMEIARLQDLYTQANNAHAQLLHEVQTKEMDKKLDLALSRLQGKNENKSWLSCSGEWDDAGEPLLLRVASDSSFSHSSDLTSRKDVNLERATWEEEKAALMQQNSWLRDALRHHHETPSRGSLLPTLDGSEAAGGDGEGSMLSIPQVASSNVVLDGHVSDASRVARRRPGGSYAAMFQRNLSPAVRKKGRR